MMTWQVLVFKTPEVLQGVATMASGYDPAVVSTITSASVGGTLFGCIVPTAVDAIGVATSSARPDVGSGITSVAGCAATSKGAPLASPTA
jgi:hypothetical protein